MSTTSNTQATSAVAGEWNGDDLPDLYVSNFGQPNQLFLGNKKAIGGFVEALSSPAVLGSTNTQSAVEGDFNNDGAQDLYTANYGQPNQLFMGDNKGGFAEVTSDAAVDGRKQSWWATVGDFNRDNTLDLYVANRDQQNELFLGRSEKGSFSFVKMTSGPAVSETKYSRFAVAGDLDLDGNQDLFVANYRQPNDLFLSGRTANFLEVLSGPAVSGSKKSMFAVAARPAPLPSPRTRPRSSKFASTRARTAGGWSGQMWDKSRHAHKRMHGCVLKHRVLCLCCVGRLQLRRRGRRVRGKQTTTKPDSFQRQEGWFRRGVERPSGERHPEFRCCRGVRALRQRRRLRGPVRGQQWAAESAVPL